MELVVALLVLIFPFFTNGIGSDALWLSLGTSLQIQERFQQITGTEREGDELVLPLWAERLAAGTPASDRRDILKFCRDKGIKHLVTGSVVRKGRQLWMTGELVNTETGESVPLEAQEGTIAEFFLLTDNLARSIAANLKLVLLPGLENATTGSVEGFEVDTHRTLARFFLEQQNGELAYQEAVALHRLRPHESEAGLLLGRAAYLLARFSEAASAFLSVVKAFPDDPAGHYYLANAYRAQGLLDDAVREYREVLRLKATSAEVYLQLAETLEKKGDLHDALAAYETFLRTAPDTPQEQPWREKAQKALRDLRKRLR